MFLIFEAIWTSTWAELAAKWVRVEAKLRHLGAKFGRSWAKLGPAGRSRLEVGPMLRPCRIETVHLDDFGPIFKTCVFPLPPGNLVAILAFGLAGEFFNET